MNKFILSNITFSNLQLIIIHIQDKQYTLYVHVSIMRVSSTTIKL